MNQFLEISNLEKLYTQNPQSIIFAFLASRHLDQGDLESALSICEKGVQKHPEYPFGHFVLGLCHYHLNDYARAKKHLEIATALDDKNPRAWKLLGEINEKLDLTMLAEECYQQYYLLDSFNPDAMEKYQKEEMIDFGLFSKDNESDLLVGEKMNFDMDKDAVEQGKESGRLFEDQLPGEDEEESFMDAGEEHEEKEKPGRSSDIVEEEGPSLSEDNLAEDKSSLREDNLQEDMSEHRTEAFEIEPDKEVSHGEETQFEERGSGEARDSIASEEEAGGEDADRDESEELLDFRSVVKDIISETEPGDREIGGESAAEENEEWDETDRPPIVTPTVGEIYIAQGRFEEAVNVFHQLLREDPENQRYQRKVNYLKQIIEEQKQ